MKHTDIWNIWRKIQKSLSSEQEARDPALLQKILKGLFPTNLSFGKGCRLSGLQMKGETDRQGSNALPITK
jgi:hypothetical protein